jgi:hypothetical protein
VLVSTRPSLVLAHHRRYVPALYELQQSGLDKGGVGHMQTLPLQSCSGLVYPCRRLQSNDRMKTGVGGRSRHFLGHTRLVRAAQGWFRDFTLLCYCVTFPAFPRIYRIMEIALEIGNQWSNQVADIWQLSGGSWFIIRRGIPLWNWMGTLSPHPRMEAGFYLFPHGFVPREKAA